MELSMPIQYITNVLGYCNFQWSIPFGGMANTMLWGETNLKVLDTRKRPMIIVRDRGKRIRLERDRWNLGSF